MIDWDDAFDNSSYHDGASALGDKWTEASKKVRATLNCETGLVYGAGARENYDVFLPAGVSKGNLIFIHGGYWHLFDKSYWSWLAQGAYDAGHRVFILNYPLAPVVSIEEIVQSVAKAVTHIAERYEGDIRICGHSAGGHLTARMACGDILSEAVRRRIAKLVAISGVYDLRPLIGIKMNDILQLDDTMAKAESPFVLTPDVRLPITLWVGACERPEFLRQTRACGERWAAQGANVKEIYEPDEDHFTVINSLAHEDGALFRGVLSETLTS